jgi:hypothetical protein
MSKQPSPQATRFIKLLNYRLYELREEDIAKKLGFNSPTDLYRRVNQDGYPICVACGTTDVPRACLVVHEDNQIISAAMTTIAR